MHKDFDAWNSEKKRIQTKTNPTFFHQREVWFGELGVNIGGEQDGTGRNFDRPIVIIQEFNTELFFCVALTGKKKQGKFYFYLGEIAGREASAVLSQVRLLNSKRLIHKIGTLDEETFSKLREATKNVLFPKN